jgi:site-specific recombinase XerD
MSSIVSRPNGHKWICYQFHKKRHTIRLGKVDGKLVEEFQRRLDRLLEYVRLGVEPEPEVWAWRHRLDERVYRNLVTAGLAPPRGPTTMGELLAAHLQSLIAKGVKPSTLVNNRVLHTNLRTFFGEGRRLLIITPRDAEQFRAYLLSGGGQNGMKLAKATVSNRCRRARGVFNYAIKNKWLSDNPFREIATGKEWNAARDRYISAEVFTKILDKSADHELRLLLAIVRYCGLRCPSEIRPLLWTAVDWEGGVLVVNSSKTEEYDSGRREVPLFPAVLPYLYAHRETCGSDELMFPNHQRTGAAITGRLASLCRKAGEVLWTKPFVNMRACAERDALQAGHPIDQVASWFGHSPAIALRHYNRVIKERKVRAASNALRPTQNHLDPKHI